MPEYQQSAAPPPAASPRERPLWKRLERQSKFQYGLALFLLSAALAVPAVSDLTENIYEKGEADRPAAAETFRPAVAPPGSFGTSSEENAAPAAVKEQIERIAFASSAGITAFLALLYSEGCAMRRTLKERQGFTKEQIDSDRYNLLPEDHPLRLRVEEYGRAAGIKVSRVYLDPVPQYRNANVYRDKEDGAVIRFRGNPLLQPQEGGRILKGVTAHELAHVKRDSFTMRALLRASGFLYGGMAAASGAMVMGGIRENFFSVMFKASPAVLACLPALSRWSKRTDEALTDLEGAEMIGDPQSVIVNKLYLQSHRPGGNDWSPSEIGGITLRARFMGVFGSTHPSHEERIANLSEVFNIHNEEQPVPAFKTALALQSQDFRS